MAPEHAAQSLGRLAEREFFHISATHAEALARLDYFARNNWGVAMLVGPAGSGRTSTLATFRRRLAWEPYAVATIDVTAQDPHGALVALAQAWKTDVDEDDSIAAVWGAMERRLRDFHCDRVAPLALIDNADFGSLDVQEALLRLASLPASIDARLQFVLSVQSEHESRLDERWRDRVDLRIDLEPWNVDEIREFLTAALPPHRVVERVFSGEAIESLHRATGGVSRKVRQLVRLALLAVAAEGDSQVDAATMAAVECELV